MTQKHDQLRQITSDHIKHHRDDFEPFLTKPLEDYCEDIESKCLWGGEIEILALATHFGRRVMVVKADGVHHVGDGLAEPPVRLSYHTHYYGLGAHYNSLVNAQEEVGDEEDVTAA